MHAQSPRRSRRKRYPSEASGSSKHNGEVRSLGDALCAHNAVMDEIRKDVEVGQFRSEVKCQGTRSNHRTYIARCRFCVTCPKRWRFDYIVKAGGVHKLCDLVRHTTSNAHEHPEGTLQRCKTVLPLAQMEAGGEFAK